MIELIGYTYPNHLNSIHTKHKTPPIWINYFPFSLLTLLRTFGMTTTVRSASLCRPDSAQIIKIESAKRIVIWKRNAHIPQITVQFASETERGGDSGHCHRKRPVQIHLFGTLSDLGHCARLRTEPRYRITFLLSS